MSLFEPTPATTPSRTTIAVRSDGAPSTIVRTVPLRSRVAIVDSSKSYSRRPSAGPWTKSTVCRKAALSARLGRGRTENPYGRNQSLSIFNLAVQREGAPRAHLQASQVESDRLPLRGQNQPARDYQGRMDSSAGARVGRRGGLQLRRHHQVAGSQRSGAPRDSRRRARTHRDS